MLTLEQRLTAITAQEGAIRAVIVAGDVTGPELGDLIVAADALAATAVAIQKALLRGEIRSLVATITALQSQRTTLQNQLAAL